MLQALFSHCWSSRCQRDYRSALKTVSLLFSYLVSCVASTDYTTPRSAQMALETFALSAFIVLATAHYANSKEYTELTAIHRGLPNTPCCPSEQ